MIAEVRFAADSLLEGNGFELPVPREIGRVSRLRLEDAKLYLAEYGALEPDMTVRRFAEQRSSVPPDAVSATYRRESERILDGMRRAGMPD